jgi:pimeloyl-ACP methyl ester carboxylesterase
VTATSYETCGAVPGLATAATGEGTVVVFVHGFGYGDDDARTLVSAYGDWLLSELDDATDVVPVGFTYDAGPIRSTAAQTKFDGYLEIARQNGPKLAQAVADMRAAGVEGVHLVGHSMGGAVAAAAVAQDTVDVSVDGLHLLGAGERASRFVEGGQYVEALRARAGAVYNYHYRGDTMLGTWFRLSQGRRAVGAGPVGADYVWDVAVSPSSHGAFPKPAADGGVMDRVAAAIASGSARRPTGHERSVKRTVDTAG